MSRRQKHLYEFGGFSLDATNRLLLREGRPVPLQPKAFDTLLLLVERRDEVLTKDELLGKLWPDSFVEESNLSQNIYVLRKVLGRGDGGEEFIKTVPKRGYRFVAGVEERWDGAPELVLEEHITARIVTEEKEAEDEPEGAEPSAAGLESAAAVATLSARPVEQARPRGWRSIVAALALLTGLLAAGAALWHERRTREQSALTLRAGLRISQLVNVKVSPGGGISGVAFSPDGKLVAFSSAGEGESSLWVKQLNGGEPVLVTDGKWRDRNPVWSSDGQQLAFLSDRGGRQGLWAIPYLGGTPALLKEIDLLEGRLTHWSADGRTIFYELRHNLYALDLASGEITRLTDFDPERSFARGFRVSPGEDRVAYSDVEGSSRIFVVPLRGGQPRQITRGEGADRQPAWFPDGERVAYSCDRAGTPQICVAYLDGRDPVQVTFGDSSNEFPAVSPDGGHILFTSQKENANVFSWDMRTGEEAGHTSSFGLQLWPDVSPDGGRVAFQSSETSTKMWEGSIVIQPAAARGQPIQVASGGYDVKWSPAGDALAFLRPSGGRHEIWKVGAAGRDEKQLTSGGVLVGGVTGVPYNRMLTNYDWSPDGAKVAYCSAKSGQANLWVISADGSNDTMVSDNSDRNLEIASPLWSPDGSAVAYVARAVTGSPGGRVLRSVRVTVQGRTEVVFQHDAPLRLVGWSASGGEVFVATGERKGSAFPQDVNLLRVSVAGKPETVARVPAAYLHNVKVSSDGQSIALVSRQDGRDNIWTVPTGGGPPKKITNNTDPTVYYTGLAWTPDGRGLYFSKQTIWGLVLMIEDFK